MKLHIYSQENGHDCTLLVQEEQVSYSMGDSSRQWSGITHCLLSERQYLRLVKCVGNNPNKWTLWHGSAVYRGERGSIIVRPARMPERVCNTPFQVANQGKLVYELAFGSYPVTHRP